MGGSKDSPEVANFSALFAEVREFCDDQPELLIALADADPIVRDKCADLSWAAHLLRMNNKRHQELFAHPVDPSFILRWREFEDRYEHTTSGVWLIRDFGSLPQDYPKDRAIVNWDYADQEARDQAIAIENALDFAATEAAQQWRDFPDGLPDTIDDGIAAWRALKEQAGFDLAGVFRRRELVPFILIPRHVAAKHPQGRRTLYGNLRQAHDSFVLGVPHAALALMRSIVETVLRDNYFAQGRDLSEMINSCRARLPRRANPAALHRLRELANAALHLDQENDRGLSQFDGRKLELEVLSLLVVLQILIEQAPQKP